MCIGYSNSKQIGWEKIVFQNLGSLHLNMTEVRQAARLDTVFNVHSDEEVIEDIKRVVTTE